MFESLAYVVAFRYYMRDRERRGDFLPDPERSSLMVAAIVGAAAGSKMLDWLEDPAVVLAHWRDPAILVGGKTVAGALLGGTMAVELAKRKLGIGRRTGDLFVTPLALGIAIGRVGCFLTGLDDHTYGTATSLPWAVDFGDGVGRHPTQIYELLALAAAIPLLRRFDRVKPREGDVFRLFLFGYCGWRVLVDFLKPDPRFGGMSAIQWACAGAMVWYARDILRILRERRGNG